MHDRKSACSGFSLIEMTITTGIFAIAASMVMGNMSEQISKYRLNGAKSELLQNIRKARADAVHQNLDVEITFDNSADQYSIWTDRNRDGTVDDGETEQFAFDDNADLWCYPNQGSFGPRGTFSSSEQYCYLSVQSPGVGYEAMLLTSNGHVGDYHGPEDVQ